MGNYVVSLMIWPGRQYGGILIDYLPDYLSRNHSLLHVHQRHYVRCS